MFLVFGAIVAILVFLKEVMYILGMRCRDRQPFKEGFKTILTQEIMDVLEKMKKTENLQTLKNQCTLLLKKQFRVTSKIIDNISGFDD